MFKLFPYLPIFLLLGISGCFSTQAQTNLPSKTVTPSVAATPPKVTPTPQADTFEDAMNTATMAVTLSQSASIKEDWQLVASQWQEAIKLLKAVPKSSKNYAAAQKKIKEYEKSLVYAQTRVNTPTQVATSNPQNPSKTSSKASSSHSFSSINQDYFNQLYEFSKVLDDYVGKDFTPVEIKYFSQKVSTKCGTGTGTLYCTLDNTIYLEVNQLNKLYQFHGEMAPVAVLTHEYGHAIATQFGIPFSKNREELFADCIAGYLFGNIYSTTGDNTAIKQGASLFKSIGDSEFNSYDHHGTDEERYAAYMKGVEAAVDYQDVSACLTYSD